MIRISAAVLALALSNFEVRSSNFDAPTGQKASAELARDLDAILASSTFARTLTAVRVEALNTGDVLYSVNADKLVVPASNLKLLTLAVAAWMRYVGGTDLDGALHSALELQGRSDGAPSPWCS